MKRFLAVTVCALTLTACADSSDSSTAPEPVTSTVTVEETTEVPADDTTTAAAEVSTSAAAAPEAAPAPSGTDVTASMIIDNGDLIFVNPDEQGVCWFYNAQKTGRGLCSVNLNNPPMIPITPDIQDQLQPANSIAFDDAHGVGLAVDVAGGAAHVPATTLKLNKGEYIDYRGIRCEATTDTAFTCSFNGQEFTYDGGNVTPELPYLYAGDALPTP